MINQDLERALIAHNFIIEGIKNMNSMSKTDIENMINEEKLKKYDVYFYNDFMKIKVQKTNNEDFIIQCYYYHDMCYKEKNLSFENVVEKIYNLDVKYKRLIVK